MKINDVIKMPKNDKLKSALVATAGVLISTQKSPDDGLGELFHDVQHEKIYNDGKTFPDLIPRRRMKQIQQEYLLVREDPNFDLREFVSRHFYEFQHKTGEVYKSDPNLSVRQHITKLWPVLERRNRIGRGSLVALPYKYFVPGGRFAEQFYWDSYFIMLGLAADNRWNDLEGMMKNYAYMIRKFGFIPTANRTYFLSRSQPPFFSHMVKLLASHKGTKLTQIEYLPYMIAEYRFWMKGKSKVGKFAYNAFARVVEMPNGIKMNRYFDNKSTPRPESLREDVETLSQAVGEDPDRLYLHLRAGAESGWDFSSRWFAEPNDIKSVHTADIIPVDLNCLLHHLESTIAESYRQLLQPLLARRFQQQADLRAKAINEYCWSETNNFYVDYDFHKEEQSSSLTLAALFPLYVKIASSKQAAAVAERIERDFLKAGGLVSTLVSNGQQWDSPNGWAPLHWVVIMGLRNYGYHELADDIKSRWVKTNEYVYKREGKLIEKYNVVDPSKLGGGGEYELQDGFGWTNGVLAALLDED